VTYHQRTLSLPDGREIFLSDDPDTWPGVGETAFVPEYAVVPDPEQPRDTSGITDSDEHESFVKSILQHGQGMIMQVRLLTPDEIAALPPEHARARYRVVDGERRFHATGKNGANLGAYEVTVRNYTEDRVIFLQQVVLNTMQEPLNSPDLARALTRIQREYEVSANRLAEMVNMSQGKVNDHLHMANLPPEILADTNQDKFKKGQRFAVKPAVALSKIGPTDELSAHDHQRQVYAEMQERRIIGANAQVAFLEQFHSEATGSHREKREPKRRRNRIFNFAKVISRSDLLDMDEAEIQRILATATNAERTTMLSKLQQVHLKLGVFIETIDRAHRSLNKQSNVRAERAQPTPPVGSKPRRLTAAPLTDSKVKPTGVEDNVSSTVREPSQRRVTPTSTQPVRKPTPTYAPQGTAGAFKPPSLVRSNGSMMGSSEHAWVRAEYHAKLRKFFPLGAQYFDPSVGRIVYGDIKNPEQFMTIHGAGHFKFQSEEQAWPQHFPSLEEVKALLEEGQSLP